MAVIPAANPDDLIRASWGQAVADELNSRTIKNNVSGQELIGPVSIEATGANSSLKVSQGSNAPTITWESNAATPTLWAHIQATATAFNFLIPVVSGSSFRWLINTVEQLELNAALANFKVVGRFARDSVAQLQLADTAGGKRCLLEFYGSATSGDAIGTRSGWIGYFAGDTLTINNGVAAGDVELVAPGQVRLTSVTGATIDNGTGYTTVNPTYGILVGKAAANTDSVGVELLGATNPTATVRGQIRGTTSSAGNSNIYLRHMTSADADNQLFVDFTRTATGTRIGSIQQNGTTGVTYGTTSDYRLKDELGPVIDPLGKLATLAPKHLAWKDGSGEFDGFIAHEVAAVVPVAVSGAKDGVLPAEDPNNPGGINPQQLDYGKLVPLLTAALQEALTKIDDLTARVATLEGAPA